MSVQFGKCNFDGKPVDPQDLHEVRPVLAPYGPDGEGFICKDNFATLYRAFHTTKESRHEAQPYVSASGFVLTWDGRLDNREELICEMSGDVSSQSTDLEIAANVYGRWGTKAFAKLIGDWALSIWNPDDRSVILAKDFVGTRHLYYTLEKDQVTWCTLLDPLVLFAEHSFEIDEEYIAGWLSFFPATHLTPYVGVRSVPPSTFVRLTKGIHRISKYWDFDPMRRIRYRSDAQYEEHFRGVFSESVRRRLRSDSPVFAELSGGMDSSSIVCLADDIIARGLAETPRLETVSYYDDSEPNWNERPYFTKVEQKRGRAGDNIDTSSQPDFEIEFEAEQFPITLGSGTHPTVAENKFAECLLSRGSRVVLSGIAGDEFLGGVPTPIPEISDALASFRVISLARELKAWALCRRTPWVHLLFSAMREFLSLAGVPKPDRPAPWLDRGFMRRHCWALHGYKTRLKFFGPLPSFQENLITLNAVRRQCGCLVATKRPVYEKRYPFLDRDLLQFLFAIPREQLLRPHQRRSLMRRAMVGFVPDEILARKRKAFVARSTIMTLSSRWNALSEMTRDMISSSLGIIDQSLFVEALQKARIGHQIPIVTLIKTLQVEQWLRALKNHKHSRGTSAAWEWTGALRGADVLIQDSSGRIS